MKESAHVIMNVKVPHFDEKEINWSLYNRL